MMTSPRRLALCLLASAWWCATAFAAQVEVHDPVMAKQGDTYTVFSTGPGITIYQSEDLEHWRWVGRVFDGEPDWARRTVPGFTGHLWAPDVFEKDGRYYLYYSVSAFGKNPSAIGVAVNRTLDPESPDYDWVDQGLVLQSIPSATTGTPSTRLSSWTRTAPHGWPSARSGTASSWSAWIPTWCASPSRRSGTAWRDGTGDPATPEDVAAAAPSRRRSSFKRTAGTTCSSPSTSAAAAWTAPTRSWWAARSRSSGPTSTRTARRCSKAAAAWCWKGRGLGRPGPQRRLHLRRPRLAGVPRLRDGGQRQAEAAHPAARMGGRLARRRSGRPEPAHHRAPGSGAA